MARRKRISEEKRAGLYTTLAFHLVVLIIILLVTITSMADRESSFILDFTREEVLEQERQEERFKEQVSRELDRQIGQEQELRNVAVDARQPLRDDRHRNPSEVYDEAKELQRRLDASRREALSEKEAESVAVSSAREEKTGKEAPPYQGPSVISWTLEGRQKHYLPVPAYKGYGAGDVYVAIRVNRKGRVVAASVIEEASTPDPQLWEYALKAARNSVFNACGTAPERQRGEIVYRFVKQ